MNATDIPQTPEQADIRRLANAIRALSMDAVEKAKSGHPGLPMGMADAATVLFLKFLKFDAADPHWPDRDRFVLSAGHGSMLLYSLLYLTGYSGMTLADIESFRQVGSPCAGHPEYGHAPGIETTTGPLGQGIANAVGMAIAERHLNARFGNGLVDHKTYVIASDGDLMEGVSQEAITLAGHLRLNRLIVLFDDNGISIDGKTSLSDSTDQIERFQSAGWNTIHVNGHDAADVARALDWAQTSDKPVLIACRTIIGFGLPTRQGTQKAHSDAPGESEIAGARKQLGWDYPPFEIPDDILSDWRAIGAKGKASRDAWTKRRTKDFDDAMACAVPDAVGPALHALKRKTSDEKPSVATRKASEAALEAINTNWAATIGGSADLTPSNNTKTKEIQSITADDFSGRYIHYGIREHGMAAAMSGMALHGGIVPYGGTFLTFSDYCRPSIRLAALMGIRVVYVMTHDSIGLGEDGPTHQPVEHFAALRAIPNLLVFRPADGVETAEAWEIALSNTKRPSLLMLSRQNLITARTQHTDENLSAKGAYELVGDASAKVTLLATGSEVELAMKARDLLAAEGIAARIVSMPCWDLFEEQPETYRDSVLGPGTVKVAVEAGVRLGWDRYIGPKGKFVGMHSFGASGPYKDVYKHFGITPEAVAEAARQTLKG
ncbi:MAG: transketolase [Alphaproteobacteria bacterium]|nr:transketolase [Alphaproteobacteria bacterium]